MVSSPWPVIYFCDNETCLEPYGLDENDGRGNFLGSSKRNGFMSSVIRFSVKLTTLVLDSLSFKK